MFAVSVTTVCPPDSAPGWLTPGVLLIVTERLPWATAQGSTVTSWFITTEPVRALMITLGDASARATGRFSIEARNPTRWCGSTGACTRTWRASSACATPFPNWVLIAAASRFAVVKSASRSSRLTNSPCPTGVDGVRSTVAPFGMRPELSWLTCTLEPPADAPAPPSRMLPCATA